MFSHFLYNLCSVQQNVLVSTRRIITKYGVALNHWYQKKHCLSADHQATHKYCEQILTYKVCSEF